MKDIVIIGAGGLGREILDIIKAINKLKPTWNVLGFYDDAFQTKKPISERTYCLGTIADLKILKNRNLAVAFGISNREVVQSMINQLQENINFNYPNIIHPSVAQNSNINMGIGNVIGFSCFLSCDIQIGDFNFLNILVALGHDVKMGSFNALMPRTQISGNVVVGDFNFFGMNSAVVQNKSIGSHNTINAFTLLTKTIQNNRKYFGIPGRRIDN